MAVEPENRTVARELERRWEQRLGEWEAVRARAAAALEHRRPLTEAELMRARELGRNLDEVWGAETTTPRDHKRLLRCLIEEVQLRSEKKPVGPTVMGMRKARSAGATFSGRSRGSSSRSRSAGMTPVAREGR
jgi:hypothetical protein